MKSESSETVGPSSCRSSDGTGTPDPQKPKRARANTNRGNLELDPPLDIIEPVTQPMAASQVVGVRTDKSVKKSLWINTAIGMVMIAVLVLGSLFGVIFAVVETHGALAAGGTPDYNTSTSGPSDSSTIFITSTLVPSDFTTLAMSSYSTLMSTVVTAYVESEATTLIPSDATTLVQSLVTLTQRDAATSCEIATVDPTVLVKKKVVDTSTIALTMSTTTTVTMSFYNTILGHDDLQNEPSGDSGTRNTCSNGDQSACISAANITAAPKSTLVTSTLSEALASSLDVSFTTATTNMPDTIATPTMTTAHTQNTDVVTITYSVSLACAATEVSSVLTCSLLPTGWYISDSSPRATSVLHSVFRFVAVCLQGMQFSGTYGFLRRGVTNFWELCAENFFKFGAEPVINSVHNFLNAMYPKSQAEKHIQRLANGHRMRLRSLAMPRAT